MAGNWKMFKTIPEALELVNGLKANLSAVSDREILVCPPFTALSPLHQALKGSNIKLGGQNLFWEAKGAYTGEIAPAMLVDAGCSYVIVGHSERRQYFGETDGTVNKRMKAAFGAGLTPIVCAGETLAEREKNATFSVIEKQVKEGIAGLTPEQAQRLVIAYEPVWAIGTGKTATPAQAEEVHAFIRGLYGRIYGEGAAGGIRILYGGSVKPDNASELMKQPNIDGGLVGGASLDIDSFTRIVKY
ncbi:MAG: triose-phosphate isomerase [Endomicrobiales bacterium]